MSEPGAVETRLGGPSVVVLHQGTQLAASAVGPVSIRRGRANTDSRPEAATASLELAVEQLPVLPRVGDALAVQLSPQALTYLGLAADHQARWRFVGQLTDANLVPASRRRPVAVVQLVAAGRRSRLGQTDVGGAAYPAELDGARAARILAEATAADSRIVAGALDPGSYTVLPRAAAVTDAASLLDALATDSGGELVELRDGTLVWRDTNSRQNLTSVTELTAGNVLVPVSWSQKLAGLLNALTLSYGDPAASVQVIDTSSRDELGRWAASQASNLADATQASSRATDLVGRHSWPRWQLPALPVDLLRTVTPAQAAALCGADYGSQLDLTGLPASGPMAGGRFFLEGASELHTRDAWQLALDVSEYAATGPAPRWVDVPTGTTSWIRVDPVTRRRTSSGTTGGLTWAGVDPALTWLGAVAFDFGATTTNRWSDQPADQRWNTTDPARTWATY